LLRRGVLLRLRLLKLKRREKVNSDLVLQNMRLVRIIRRR
jgi:hypothetical protein